MAYSVLLSPTARRQLEKLPPGIRQRMRSALARLADDPRPPGIKAMEDEPGLFRLRVGEYRATYRIDDAGQSVRVEQVGHRRDIYR
jgi:mRNA interferase RelE/StbE